MADTPYPSMKVVNITGYRDLPSKGSKNGNGGDPPMSDLERRVQHLEEDMREVRDSTREMKANYATSTAISDLRTEMHSLLRQQIMWSVGSVIAAVGLAVAIIKAIH